MTRAHRRWTASGVLLLLFVSAAQGGGVGGMKPFLDHFAARQAAREKQASARQPVLTLPEAGTFAWGPRNVLAATLTVDSPPNLVQDGHRLGRVALWDAATGAKLLGLRRGGEPQGLAFSPDGRYLASGAYNGAARRGFVRLWEPKTGRHLLDLPGPFGDPNHPYENGILSLAFSPDGRHLAVQYVADVIGPHVFLYEADSWAVRRRFGEATARRRTVPLAFSPDGTRLAFPDGVVAVRVVSVEDGRVLATVGDLSLAVGGPVAFSPDGSALAVGVEDVGSKPSRRVVRVYAAAGGALLRTLPTAHLEALSALSFSPDGRLLASGSLDKTIEVRHWETGRLVETLANGPGAVYALAFHPEDPRVLASSDGRSLRVWRIE
ncbi:MAG: WD40 repeat domain-containing protein [Deferrisomatales bacterium]